MESILTPAAAVKPLAGHEGVRYCLVQYMDDVFRREVRNVGVVVSRNGETVARFVGETESGVIDGRRLRAFAAPDVYRQWVQYWRRTLYAPDALEKLQRSSSGNFLVVEGGTVTDTGDDPLADVAAYLYASLVSEGGFASAYDVVQDAESAATSAGAPKLQSELTDAFRSLLVLEESPNSPGLVRYPVRHKAPVRGKTSVAHEPQFSQQNGKLFVIEPIDFADRSKERARDHAGLTAFMFGDLVEEYGTAVKTIAIVRPAEQVDETSLYAMAMLDKVNAEIVDWTDASARDSFLADRRRIAYGS